MTHSLIGKFAAFIIQFVFLAVYARIFTPQEFGIVASIQVFILFFQMLSDMGVGAAIINQNSVSSDERNGVFTFTILMGIFLAIATYLLSFLLVFFYNGYDYTNLSEIIAVSVFFSSLNIVPNTALIKSVQFLKISRVTILSELVSFVFVYLLYSNNLGVVALASRTMFQSIFRFLFTYHGCLNTSLGRPSIGMDFSLLKKISSFSSYQLGFNFINYFSRNLDTILVGKFFGMQLLGVYDKAYQLMRYPLMLTTMSISPAIQPVLAKHKDDISYIVSEHNLLVKRLISLSIIIAGVVLINARDIVLLLFGDAWIASADYLIVFAFSIPIQAALSTSGSFFQVLNKVNVMFYSGSVAAVINVFAMLYGVYLDDVFYVALFLVFSFTVNFVQIYYCLFRFCFKVNVGGFVKSVILPLIILVPIVTLGYYIKCKFSFFSDGTPFENIFTTGFLISGLCFLPFFHLIKK